MSVYLTRTCWSRPNLEYLKLVRHLPLQMSALRSGNLSLDLVTFQNVGMNFAESCCGVCIHSSLLRVTEAGIRLLKDLHADAVYKYVNQRAFEWDGPATAHEILAFFIGHQYERHSTSSKPLHTQLPCNQTTPPSRCSSLPALLSGTFICQRRSLMKCFVQT